MTARLIARLLLAIAVLLPAGGTLAAPSGDAPRVAIVIGATAPVPGRVVLRHAHRDAEAVRDALVAVGGFEAGRVHVLRDPEPAALLALVAREAGALAGVPHGLLLFYFSGHADGGALYSAGKAVPIEALRAALDRPEVSLRLGVVDACQGGGWTRAKGLSPEAPFEVTVPSLLASEGSALIASSSGSGAAHESDALGGSFFTHHFVAALRGAGDERRRGEVTLTEAFEYARQQTVRDTARRAAEPQHPSFAINLKGRQDVVLAHLASSPSSLALDQSDGPIELIHMGTGLRVLELPQGRRQVVLAVPAGTYLVRRVDVAGVSAREVVVPPAGVATVSEQELVLVATDRLALKGREPVVQTGRWPARGGGELGASLETWRDARLDHLGVGTGDALGAGAMVRFDGRYGLTDRLAWKFGTLALSYRLGERGGLEVAPYAGLLSWRSGLERARDTGAAGEPLDGTQARLGGGLGLRAPFQGGAAVFTLGGEGLLSDRLSGGWQAHVAAGLSLAIGPYLTVHLAVSASRSHQDRGSWNSTTLSFRDLTFGSVQEFGLESLPLLRVHPWDAWAIDFFAAGGDRRRVSYRLGVSRTY